MLPRVIVYNAVSADGRIDWLSPDIGQFYGLASHWHEDVTLAGSDTILGSGDETPPEDESAFQRPAQDPADRRPLLVVPDSRGRLHSWHALRQYGYWRDAVALVSQATPRDYLDYLNKRHVDYIVAGKDRVDFRAALQELSARYGARVVRVDSGGTLNGVLLRAGLVDEVSLLVYPSLVGGTTPRSMFRAPDLTSPAGVIPLRLTHVERLPNEALWLRYEVVKAAP